MILRNVLENPGWYTQYTPYQAEISQGRLEALINFQQMVEDLDRAADGERVAARRGNRGRRGHAHVLRSGSARQTHELLGPRRDAPADDRRHAHARRAARRSAQASARSAEIEAGLDDSVAGVLISYPTTDGHVIDHRALCAKIHAAGATVCMATDLLALTLIVPPGELGADIAIGTAQRFGVPMGFGGPHAAFLATKDELRRQMPGRIIGVSRDAKGKTAFRLALQTREQHIRREKATSNICTAQVLLAVMASMYAVYHGPDGLQTHRDAACARSRR